jgi:hypothetical protein
VANPQVADSAVSADTNVGDLIDRYPEILGVLEEYGIRMDPSTYILLRGSVQEAAEYNAILDFDEFRRALARCVQQSHSA